MQFQYSLPAVTYFPSLFLCSSFYFRCVFARGSFVLGVLRSKLAVFSGCPVVVFLKVVICCVCCFVGSMRSVRLFVRPPPLLLGFGSAVSMSRGAGFVYPAIFVSRGAQLLYSFAPSVLVFFHNIGLPFAASPSRCVWLVGVAPPALMRAFVRRAHLLHSVFVPPP